MRPPFGARAKLSIDCVIWSASPMLIGLTFTLSAGATVAIAANWLVPEPCEESRRIATRVTLGTVSLSNSSHLAAILYSKLIKPVMLPPGRAINEASADWIAEHRSHDRHRPS